MTSAPPTLRPGDPVTGLPGAQVTALLKDDRYARTARIRLDDGTSAVWKRSVVSVPPGVALRRVSRQLARREADHLERLAGLSGIPALLARPTDDAFVRRWIDGETLRDSAHVPDPFFPALRDLVAAVHARGVAYADLAKEENLIVDPHGLPWLVDFQISVARGSPAAAFVRRLQASDRWYLARHVKRRRPDQMTDEERELIERGPGGLRRAHRVLVKKPYNFMTRHLVRRWSGAGEGRRPDEPRGLHGRD
jgi:RIO-like serine/threonine protein kinase